VTTAGAEGARERLPRASVARLPSYLLALDGLWSEGTKLTSSHELAARSGVSPEQLRKDLSFLGSYGRRGVGYDVAQLRGHIGAVLGLEEPNRVVIVGVGHLGHALAAYGGFAERGFSIVGLIDDDPEVVGTTVAEIVVRPSADLADVVSTGGATIGVIATPAAVAQQVADALAAAGVHGILTFAPQTLQAPGGVQVRAVDLASELQLLAFHGRHRDHVKA
jgi:redox-sensing transcriptional repressor